MLTALDVFGFKSFADKTRFDFPSGVTAVVGPNGSGKSNVVDALKWIFGDQSAKSLRGKEMTDVIFNGAANRKASSYAEAVLTFDNTSGFLPVESAEVQIGRRLWRNGDSEYLINQDVARLKDVRNLLMGTGVGAAAYCIIEQGRVDQILQANASTRRVVFEEAAGISRYKSRRTEALRKLDRVEQNLLRLTDIVEEVESQLSSLRNQAAKATRHRDLSTRLREMWIGLAADDYRLLTAESDAIDEQRAALQQDVDECITAQSAIEEELRGLDGKLGELDEALREVESRQTEKRESLAATEATVRHQSNQLRELKTEITRLQRQSRTMNARSQESILERRHLLSVLETQRAELDRLRQEASERQSEVDVATARISEARSSIERSRSELMEKLRDSSSTEGLVQNLESQVAQQRELVSQIESQIGSSEQRLAEESREFELASERSQQLARSLADAEDDMRQIQTDRQSLIGEQGEYQRSLAELRETRSAWEARKSVLEDLESRQEGMGIGVREILNRARTSNYAPWTEIIGSVADLLEVDMEQAALVEVALGQRSQLVVVQRLAPVVEYLQKDSTRISGRVGFLALDSSSILTAQGVIEPDIDRRQDLDLSDRAGIVCRADQMVSSKDERSVLASRLLSDTWVVERLEDALHLFRDTGGKCRFVTLQGEVVERDGRLLVGSLHAEAALMSRKSELRRLRNDLLRLDSRVQEEEFRLKKLAESVTSTDSQLTSAEQVVKDLAAEYTAARADEDARKKEVERLEGSHAELQESQSAASGKVSQIEQELADAKERITRLTSEIEERESELKEVESSLASDEAAVSAARDRMTHCQAAEDQQQERIEASQTSFERLEREFEQRSQEQDEANARLDAIRSKLSETTLQVLNHQGRLSEEVIELDRLADEVAGFIQQRVALRGERSALLDREIATRSRSRSAEDRLHELEMNERDMRHRLTTLETRITEEYGIAVEDACAEGASAYKAYKLLHQPAEAEDQSDSHDAEVEPAVSSDEAVEGVVLEDVTTDEPDQSGELAESGGDSRGENHAEELTSHDDQMSSIEDADGSFDENAEDGILDSEEDVAEDGQIDEADSDATAEGAATDETASETEESLEVEYEGYEEVRPELEAEVESLRRKLKHLGSVSSDSLANLDELESRFTILSTQLADLQEARNALDEIIKRINSESRRMFLETFDSIRGHFQELFRKLFGGGEGDIILEDMDDVLECGIDIVARPPGKELRSLSLLSGGEKTMTAVALLLAIFRSRPSPFCVLDEVDAALDEANVARFVGVLKEFQESTQFIMITHRKPSMASADVLYGVTMEESGVSKRMSVRFEDIGENGDFVPPQDDGGQSVAA